MTAKYQNRMQTDRNTREGRTVPPAAAQASAPADQPRKIWDGPDVDFNPAVCPNCGSARNHISKTYGAVAIHPEPIQKRLHDCENCGCRFRSQQTVPAADVRNVRFEG